MDAQADQEPAERERSTRRKRKRDDHVVHEKENESAIKRAARHRMANKESKLSAGKVVNSHGAGRDQELEENSEQHRDSPALQRRRSQGAGSGKAKDPRRTNSARPGVNAGRGPIERAGDKSTE